MEDFIEQVGPWGWILIGLVLLVLEVFIAIPGSLFLFTGVAALIVGVSAILFDWAWQFQLVGFGVLSIILVMLGRRYFSFARANQDAEVLNVRAVSMVGSVYLVVEPIIAGQGRVKVGDSSWGVTGPDSATGTRVRVISADGATLVVEPIEGA